MHCPRDLSSDGDQLCCADGRKGVCAVSLLQQLAAKVLICAGEKAPATSPSRLLTCGGNTLQQHIQACILRNHPSVTWQGFMSRVPHRKPEQPHHGLAGCEMATSRAAAAFLP